MKTLISAEYAREAFRYDPETGKLFWKERPRHHFDTLLSRDSFTARFSGKPAGFFGADGYRRIRIGGRNYLAHRLVWLMVHGSWPSDQIDHINHQPDDNRIANLRVVTNHENQRNAGRRRDNSSGFCGVYWHKVAGKWAAFIHSKDGRKIVRRFDTITEAVSQRLAWELEFDYSPTHGRPNPKDAVNS